MEIFIKVIQFLLSLSILILLHELGHFMFARLFKTRVEKFYLFFNPWFSIFKIKKGDTEYGLGWLPLGGYVKIAGMIDESMDKEQLKQPPQPHEFRSKPAWQRLLIISGGVTVNFLLAIVIYSMVLFVWGERYLPTKNLTYGVSCSPLALELGFENGDMIKLVNGSEVENFQEVMMTILLNKGSVVTIERNDQIIDIPIDTERTSELIKAPLLFTPRIPLEIAAVEHHSEAERAGIRVGDRLKGINGAETKFFDEFKAAITGNIGDTIILSFARGTELVDIAVTVPESGIIGVRNQNVASNYFEFKTKEYTLLGSIPAGVRKGASTINSYLKQLKLVFTPSTRAYESVGGFITIGNIFPGTWDWQAFWSLTALLSIALAIMNLLPIPALDGGFIAFILYEMVTGHKPSDKFMEYAQIAGLAIVLFLFLFANLNDVIKLFQ